MRALQLAMEQQHAVPRNKIAKFLVAGENLTVSVRSSSRNLSALNPTFQHMTREKFATTIRRIPSPEILLILKL